MSWPSVNVWHAVAIFQMKSSQLYVINGLVMLVTFFFCRVVMFPYVLYLYSQLVGLSYWEVRNYFWLGILTQVLHDTTILCNSKRLHRNLVYPTAHPSETFWFSLIEFCQNSIQETDILFKWISFWTTAIHQFFQQMQMKICCHTVLFIFGNCPFCFISPTCSHVFYYLQ